MIILIFGSRDLASVLAHASLHSVIRLTLLLIDANSLFHQLCLLVQPLGEEAICSILLEGLYVTGGFVYPGCVEAF